MKPAAFSYQAPTTIDEALALLADAGGDARILAGGQSLVPAMAFRLAQPAMLVDINGLSDAPRLAEEDGRLEIGPLVRHQDIRRLTPRRPLTAMLSTMAQHVGPWPVRSRGTFCGSLAHADPASEWALAVVALDANLTLESTADGPRSVPAGDFFSAMMATSAREDEMLTAVTIPDLAAGTRWGFAEIGRRTGDFAIVLALAIYEMKGGRMSRVRIAVGGAEAVPRRLVDVETVLEGTAPSKPRFLQAAEYAADVVDPLEDGYADALYRRDLVRALVLRALQQSTR
ncbi:xanthine dehydrogenase family protein subunit M [Amorphus sp. 3PC139-8]|uniref:FAD binding domain-containing protein n=1 Tax=Amorphus sp. 3PC139-8 TaxID=2735676 RepID=UPI00345C6B78